MPHLDNPYTLGGVSRRGGLSFIGRCVKYVQQKTPSNTSYDTSNICKERADNNKTVNNESYNDDDEDDNDDEELMLNGSKAKELRFVVSGGKQINITSDDDIDIITENTFNSNNSYKDALLASLYSQVEFLRNEIEGKNLLICTLIIKESVYNCVSWSAQNTTSDTSNSSSTDESEHDNLSGSDVTYSGELVHSENLLRNLESPEQRSSDEGDNNNNAEEYDIFSDNDFNTLYLQYERDRNEENIKKLENQLKIVLEERRKKYVEQRDKIIYRNNTPNSQETTNTTKWHPNTILITGDLMLNQLVEKRLAYSVKWPV